MKSFKLWFIPLLVVCVAAAGLWVYNQGLDYGARKYAQNILDKQTKEITDENKKLQKQKEEYEDTIENINDNFVKNFGEDSEIKKYYDEIEKYEQDIEKLDAELEQAEKEKQSLLEYGLNMSEISNDKIGEAKKLEPGTYQCPDDIAEGRYIAEGTGSFRIVSNISNNILESQDLSKLDSKTYTFNIEKETRMITDGEIIITASE